MPNPSMKKSKLSTKFILLFTAVLTGIFAVMLAAVYISVSVSLHGYVYDSVLSYHDDVDDSVVAVIDEVAYAYARMTDEDNAGTLDDLRSGNSYAVRTEALRTLAALAQTDTFADIGWRDEGGYISVNGYIAPSEEAFAAAQENSNRVTLGEYRDGCHALIIYMDNGITLSKGCFVFFLPETAISYCLSSMDSGSGYSYIIGTDGYIFSHGDKDYVGRLYYYGNLYDLDGGGDMRVTDMDGERKVIVVSPMQTAQERYGFDFFLVSILDYDYYYGTFTVLSWVLTGIMIAIFVAGVVVAIVRAKKISRPIAELHADVERTIRTGRKGDLKFSGNDELFRLEEKYDEMITHIFELMQKSREDAETQRKLELDALQMQINPHFLYNTLDAVSWMAKLKGEPEIENLTLNLAKFFRLSLHKGDKFITVGEELELTWHYLEIDKVRFPDKVKVHFETDESLVNYKVLKLILQPVVENAVKYAFEEKSGNLVIRTMLSGGDIVFEVEDDGCGFDMSGGIVSSKKKSDLGGFGLKNVDERIKLEYGEDYGLSVRSAPGQGTKVTIRIQKRI